MKSTNFLISRQQAGLSISEFLRSQFGMSRPEVRFLLKNKKVRIEGRVCKGPWVIVRQGQKIQVEVPKPKLPPTKPIPKVRNPENANNAAKIPIVFIDKHILVVDKPAGITTVRHAEEVNSHGARAKKYLPPTLVDLLTVQLHGVGLRGKMRIRAVHRLDKETSGLLVLARTELAEKKLGRQIREKAFERKYLALVRGKAQSGRVESMFVNDRGDGRRGSSAQAFQGKQAITHIHVLEALGEFSLVECRLETGRTHQVRIHLGEQGNALCGEHIYDRPLHGQPTPDKSNAQRPMLHAAHLSLNHPITGEILHWSSPLPADMKTLLQKLRGQK